MLARDNTDGVVGVAPGIWEYQQYVFRVLDGNGTIWFNQVVGGYGQAQQYGIDLVVAHYPYSGTPVQNEANVIAAYQNAGGIVVASVGNVGGEFSAVYPPSFTSVVGVSGVKDDGSFTANPVSGCDNVGAGGSIYGSFVDVAAGYWAYTTHATSAQQSFLDMRADNGVCGYTPAAHVGGVVLLLRAHRPSWPPVSILQALFKTSSHYWTPNNQIGNGIPNAVAALSYVPKPVATISGPDEVPAWENCAWDGLGSGGTGGPYTFNWYWDGQLFESETGASSWVTRNTGSPGSHQLKLTVADGVGTGIDIMYVDVGSGWCGL